MGLQFQTTSGRHYFEVFTIMKAFAALLPALLASTKAEAEADPYWTPAVYTASGLVAHANGALVPDYTPAQKAAAAAHLTAKANEYTLKYAYAYPYHAAYAHHPYAAYNPYGYLW